MVPYQCSNDRVTPNGAGSMIHHFLFCRPIQAYQRFEMRGSVERPKDARGGVWGGGFPPSPNSTPRILHQTHPIGRGFPSQWDGFGDGLCTSPVNFYFSRQRCAHPFLPGGYACVSARRGFTLGQGAIAHPKPEPCPQMFWLQQQYAVLKPANYIQGDL